MGVHILPSCECDQYDGCCCCCGSLCAAILKLGVDPSKVVLVLPPFARGSLMMDPLVEEKLFERLNSLGVRVLQNFSLCDFESNDLREVTASIFEVRRCCASSLYSVFACH